MGDYLTHTVSGNIASFKSADIMPIESLKVYFNPVQAGTGDPSPTNVRPITGWNQIKYANLTGLLSSTKTSTSASGINIIIDNTTPFIHVQISGTATASSNIPFVIIPTEKITNKTYYIYGIPSMDYVAWFCGNGNNASSARNDPNVVSGNELNGSPIVATGETQLRIYLRYINGKTYNLDFYVCISDVAPLLVSFPETVYGGYVDLISGQLVQTHAKLIEDGSVNPDTWLNTLTSYGRFFSKPLSYLGSLQPKYAYQSGVFNYLKSPLANESYRGAIGTNANPPTNELRILLPNSSFGSVSALTSYLSENPLEVVYELETPIIYQLTPTQLKTFLDYNNIWSNTNGNIEVTYQFQDHLLSQRMLVKQPHIATATGAIASFNTDMKAPLKSAKVYFNPIQEGTGDPSPENIRNISGWTNILIKNSNIELNKINTQINRENLAAYGLTLNVSEDGRHFSIEGTANSTRRLNLCGVNTTDNTLYMSGFPILTNGATWSIYHDNTILEEVEDINNHSYNLNNAGSLLRIGLSLINGTYYNLDFYPVVSTEPPINISFSDIYYGGYVDLITGELVETHICRTVPYNEPWSLTSIGNLKFWTIKNQNLPLAPVGTLGTTINSHFKNKTDDNATVNIVYSLYPVGLNNGTFAFGNGLCESLNLTTSEEINAWIKSQSDNNTPVQVCYPLETPIVHQLTPTQLSTLIGQNNIWSNANGNIEVKYWTH